MPSRCMISWMVSRTDRTNTGIRRAEKHVNANERCINPFWSMGTKLNELYIWRIMALKQLLYFWDTVLIPNAKPWASKGIRNVIPTIFTVTYTYRICHCKSQTPHVWASCQIRKIAGAHALGMPGTSSPSPQVSDPDMHHGTCVTHVPWCMPGSLTSSFLWNRRRGKTFPAFPAHAQPAILRIW